MNNKQRVNIFSCLLLRCSFWFCIWLVVFLQSKFETFQCCDWIRAILLANHKRAYLDGGNVGFKIRASGAIFYE